MVFPFPEPLFHCTAQLTRPKTNIKRGKKFPKGGRGWVHHFGEIPQKIRETNAGMVSPPIPLDSECNVVRGLSNRVLQHSPN